MPPTAQEVAARALEAAQKAEHAAEIAKMVADAAKMTAASMVLEMRERFDQQDQASREFRETLMREIQSQNRAYDLQKRSFDEFKTDFEDQVEKMDQRCSGHDDALFGNDKKNIKGVLPTTEKHDNIIKKLLWSWAIIMAFAGWMIWYVVFFYGDSMKRGIFNPTDAEWHWRVTKEVKKTVKADALKPDADVNN